MYRIIVLALRKLNSFASSFCAAWFVVVAALLLAVATPPRAHAITLNMTYFNEGDPVPHDENPTWDPDGTILKAHFQAAKTIWESLLPGGGSYDFDFEWDDDISGLGLTTPGASGDFIEISPNQSWFADPTPGANEEYLTTPTQTLFSQLSASDQSTYFPGTAPPGALETRYNLTGTAGTPGAGGFHAQNGVDLMTVIMHEIGHVLGIAGIEPGEYNIYPQHVGGLNNVLVLEDDDSGHLAGNTTTPGFLMCEACELTGRRRLPSATDVLVIAEDQGITVVQLARVGRISSGVWSDANAWIGGDVPDGTQDVYISHGGTVTLNSIATAKNLLVSPGNTLDATSRQFITTGTLTFTGGALNVNSSGTIAANNLVGDPIGLTTQAGSLIRFNQFSGNIAAAANFAGSLAIGYYTGSSAPAITYDPSILPTPITTWTIGENLKIADERDATLVVKNSTWNVTGNISVGSAAGHLNIKSGGTMTVGGNVDVRGSNLGFSDVTVDEGGALNVTGNVIASPYGRVTYKTGTLAADETFDIRGGTAFVRYVPPAAPYFASDLGGSLTIEGTANVVDSAMTVDGGTGNGAPGGSVTFKTGSTASNAEIRTKGGHKGSTSPLLNGLDVAGTGGIVRFEGNASAWQATFENEGISEYIGGIGGRTIFADSSTARDATINNHGATFFSFLGAAPSGETHFLNNSTAEEATITNHGDGASIILPQGAATIFYDSSNAGSATIENRAGPSGSVPGRTEFRNNSSAASATINNRGYIQVGEAAGRTLFYDSATAANATLRTYDGYSDHGRIEFRNQSTAASAHIFIENEPLNSASAGGYLNFFDNSTAAQSEITLRAGANGTVQFYNNATAANAQIITETGTGNPGNIFFNDNATAANANISLGELSFMAFYGPSTAANATITMANRAQIQFQGGSAGQAQIVAAGGSTYTAGSQAFIHFLGAAATAANSTITVNGATATLASPALVQITSGASPGNATLIANGGSNGGAGGTILFNGAANGSTARLVANAGGLVDFFSQAIYNDISFGSIEGAGTFHLRGAHVITGSRNTSTTVSGPIVDTLVYPTYTGGRLTKVGAGTLTLAGTNTYTGLTTVNAGAVSVTGSIAGDAIVNSGGTLGGTGTIGGTVTVNSGGVFAPGTSPGTLTLGGLTMTSGSTLNFELGDPARDHIVLTNNGNVSLGGTLNVSLLPGYTPTIGQTFPLFEGAIGSVTGAFASFLPPVINDLMIDLRQIAGSLVLQVVGATLPGDFNDDGAVDARDYVVWRKGLGAPYTQTHYNTWRAHFGQPGGNGASTFDSSSSLSSVPEPATLILLLLAVLAMPCRMVCGRAPRIIEP